MANHSAEVPALPACKTITRGLKAFIIFSVMGILLGLWWKRPDNIAGMIAHLDWKFVALVIPLVGLDYLLGGLRYRIFFDGKMLPIISMWNCMRSNWANIFMGAATPFQTGGGAAQIYLLWRYGARISDGMLISLLNWVATLFFFMISTVFAVILLPADLFGNNFTQLIRSGFIFIGGFAGLLILILAFPAIGLVIIKQFFRLIPLRHEKYGAFRQRALIKLNNEVNSFQLALKQILQLKMWSLPVVILTTVALFSNKYLIGYAIARGLGYSVPFGPFIGLQIIQLFLIYFAPTPGASGMAELSSVWLMGKILPPSVLLVYAIMVRFFTTICGAIIGSVVLMNEMRQMTRHNVNEDAITKSAHP